MIKFCYIDTETRSKVDINEGIDRYARAAELTVVTWALGDEPVHCWDVLDQPETPIQLAMLTRDVEVVFVAHNASFDIEILQRCVPEFAHVPVLRFWDTRAQAYAHGLPGSLEACGFVLGLPADMQKMAEDGHRLIQVFCIPQGNDDHFIQPWDEPEQWELFKHYAIRDTEVLREIHKRLPTRNYGFGIGDIPLWHLDQKINRRGFRLDTKLCNTAVDFLKTAKTAADIEMAKATDGAVHSATQRNALLDYLQNKLGLNIPNMRASELRGMLESDDISPEARYLIEMRLENSKSAGAKYRRGLQVMGPDDRVRYGLQYGGAGRTGRWSGKGFQVHNMSRPAIIVRHTSGPRAGRIDQIPVKAKYIDEVVIPGIYSREALSNPEVFGVPNEAASLAVRHAIIAAPGNELVVGDWSNIESRVLAWLADEDWKLKAYEAVDRGEGDDLYKLLFASFFGANVKDVNDNERQSGKVSELAFGFGGGVGALVTMAATYQMDLEPLADIVLPRATEVQLQRAYKAWRRAFLRAEDFLLEPRVYMACDVLKQSYRASNAKIDTLRHDVGEAILEILANPKLTRYIGKCQIWSSGTALFIDLPSGRRLCYWGASIAYELDYDEESGKEKTRSYITYFTPRGKKCVREKAWDGLFVENIVQAVANDILRGALKRIDRDAWSVPEIERFLLSLPIAEQTSIALHVHDEVGVDVPKGSYPLERLLRVMVAGEKWSAGLPLHAAGWNGPRYGKR